MRVSGLQFHLKLYLPALPRSACARRAELCFDLSSTAWHQAPFWHTRFSAVYWIVPPAQ